jgi:hypothetical protein
LHPTTRQEKSREQWRAKAVSRNRKLRTLNKRHVRQAQRLKDAEAKILRLEEQQKAGACDDPPKRRPSGSSFVCLTRYKWRHLVSLGA